MKNLTEYTLIKEPYSEYRDNRTRYYSLIDSNYFDSKTPLIDAKKYAIKKGYKSIRIIYPSLKKQDKIITL
jgi:hypothetical protein